MIIKYCNPSRFDYAPEGSVARVQKDNDVNDTTRVCSSNYEYYIQISEYKDLPNWVKWDYFLGLLLKDKAIDQEFVSKCLEAFKAKNSKNTKDFKDNINEIIDQIF